MTEEPRKETDILVFKTTIRYKKDVKALSGVLCSTPGIVHWNVDLEDCDKVLRVGSATLCAEEVIVLVRHAGYHCEELI